MAQNHPVSLGPLIGLFVKGSHFSNGHLKRVRPSRYLLSWWLACWLSLNLLAVFGQGSDWTGPKIKKIILKKLFTYNLVRYFQVSISNNTTFSPKACLVDWSKGIHVGPWQVSFIELSSPPSSPFPFFSLSIRRDNKELMKNHHRRRLLWLIVVYISLLLSRIRYSNLCSFELSSLFIGCFFLTGGCSSETSEKEKKKGKIFVGIYQWLECFLVWSVHEGDGSIWAVACRIHQAMVGQGGHLSVYTQAAMKPIIPQPLQWYLYPLLFAIFSHISLFSSFWCGWYCLILNPPLQKKQRKKSLLSQASQDEELESGAREAKERLDGRFKAQRKSETKR